MPGQHCLELGSTLAKVDSAADNEELANLTLGLGAWIGLTDELIEGEWLWTDGTRPHYTNWDNTPGFPQQPQWSQDYNCARVVGSNARWSNARCGSREFFICNQPSISGDSALPQSALDAIVASVVVASFLAGVTCVYLLVRRRRRIKAGSLLDPPMCTWDPKHAGGYACFISHYKVVGALPRSTRTPALLHSKKPSDGRASHRPSIGGGRE